MEEKIQEKTKKLQQIIDAISDGRNQITKLDQEGLMLQGELRLLNELKAEKEAEENKDKKTK